jgi:hypothetical protein
MAIRTCDYFTSSLSLLAYPTDPRQSNSPPGGAILSAPHRRSSKCSRLSSGHASVSSSYCRKTRSLPPLSMLCKPYALYAHHQSSLSSSLFQADTTSLSNGFPLTIYPLLTSISLVDACNTSSIPESLHECAPALKLIQISFPKPGHYTGTILYADWKDMNKTHNVPNIDIMIIPDVWFCFLLLFWSMQAMLHNSQGRPEYTQTITVQPYIPSQGGDRESALKYLDDVKERDVRVSQRKHRRVSPYLLFLICCSCML